MLASRIVIRNSARSLLSVSSSIRSRFSPSVVLCSGGGTVNDEEVGRFSALASEWWDELGSLKALHSMNRVRVPWIRDTLLLLHPQETPIKPSRPLSGLKLVDVGCGAGILTEPLARLGAEVTGLDAAHDCVAVAEGRAGRDAELASRLRYSAGSVEEFLGREGEEGAYDAVVASEILEHVENRREFVNSTVKLLKPNGVVFFTTLNKTWLSKALGVWAAESLLGIVPPGTHDWEKFTPPGDLELMLEGAGCSLRLLHGLSYNPLANRWSWGPNTSISYALHAVRTS